MTELEAKNIISNEIKKTILSFDIDVIGRDFRDRCSEYIAQIVVIVKDEMITEQTISDLKNKLINDGIEDIWLVDTKKDLRVLEWEVLTLEAKITIKE